MSRAQTRWMSSAWSDLRSRSKALTQSLRSVARRPLARQHSGRRLAIVAGIAALLVATGIGVIPRAFAADPCNPLVNPIACENSKTGNSPDEWDITGVGDATIQGFATSASVNVGSAISFKINTTAPSYRVDIYRLGYYNGNGARKQATINVNSSTPQSQACVADPNTEIFDCGRWVVSASWTVPSTAVSGVYIAKLTTNKDDASQIPFVVRNDASTSKLFMKTSDATWQAYNRYGGSDFYTGQGNGRAYKLSYNRPYATRGLEKGRDYLFSNEYPMIRFLESNGYDVSYTTDVDTDVRGNLIKNHKVFLSVGHDEYWTGTARANVESARDDGVHLAFFSGNEVYWKTRLEPSQDGSNTANRTLVCYKETWANRKLDPSPEWTGTWRDPRFSPPANGGRPENALTGTMYMANSDDLPIQVPAQQGKNRFWRGTSVASLGTNQTATLAQHTVGYESNEDLDNGFRPAGLIRLSTTVGPTPEYLQDFGNVVKPGTTTHRMTLYRAASGALVFSAGTIQYAWGLDANHDGNGAPADPALRQATVNLFADMGVQPTTLVSGLIASAASSDTQGPNVTITSPAAGASFANGAQIALSGTATDVGGGVVAGVEVSLDSGATWHPANGTSSWTYSFISTGMSTQTVLVRGIDDSANVGANPTSRTFTLTGAHTLFGATVPKVATSDDTGSVELGVHFVPQTDGVVTGVRFYKGTGNTGQHTGTLWSLAGSKLATGIFTSETASGWQTLTFGTPVQVTAGQTYVASYRAPNGHYASDEYFFSYGDWVAGPLKAPRLRTTNGNGVSTYGNGVPTDQYRETNYYVDVTFVAANDAAPYVTSVSPMAGAGGVPFTVQPSATFSKSLAPATVAFTLKDPANATVAGTATYNDSLKTVTFAPAANLASAKTYTATASGQDASGNPATFTWSFTTDLDATVLRLFPSNLTPAVLSDPDTDGIELGVKFTPSVNGTVVGVRYYAGPGNIGTHTGALWSSSGSELARVTFPTSSGVGWQVASFTTPVAVTAGTTYVASYFAPNGHYSSTSNFFASTYTNGPLSAPGGSNGVYRYGATSTFPNNTFGSTNYWVDPLFVADPVQPSPTPTPTVTPTPTPSSSPTTPPPTGTQLSLFAATDTPVNPAWNDTDAVEVGVKFTTDVTGVVTGVRFYKGATNTGTHTGTLWSAATNQILATGTFTNETASGWQTLTFTQPVTISPGTTYVVSYHTNVGRYSVDLNYFTTGFDKAPLRVPSTGAVYRYGPGNAFPNNTARHNYWVDVVFIAS